VGADAASGTDAFEESFARPIVLVVGHEREGMSPRVRAQCDAVVAIRGAGGMDSLNVGVASGVLIAELSRVSTAARARTR
jgi:tRNA G18 (ribose-2'-O)-methylase SpoU